MKKNNLNPENETAASELNNSTGYAPTDKNGNQITAGDWVTVHQDDEVTVAQVVEATRYRPTRSRKKGWWIEIERSDGQEAMMSYILELIA